MAELGGGEVGIIPVEGVRGGEKLNGMLMDPTRKSSWRNFVPGEALAAEKSGGEVEWAGKREGGHGGNEFNGLWEAEKWDDEQNENWPLVHGMDLGGVGFCLGAVGGGAGTKSGGGGGGGTGGGACAGGGGAKGGEGGEA